MGFTLFLRDKYGAIIGSMLRLHLRRRLMIHMFLEESANSLVVLAWQLGGKNSRTRQLVTRNGVRITLLTPLAISRTEGINYREMRHKFSTGGTHLCSTCLSDT